MGAVGVAYGSQQKAIDRVWTAGVVSDREALARRIVAYKTASSNPRLQTLYTNTCARDYPLAVAPAGETFTCVVLHERERITRIYRKKPCLT